MFFFTKVYILLLKGKAPKKEIVIIETKLPLNPTHSYHLFMLVDIFFLWFSVCLQHYELFIRLWNPFKGFKVPEGLLYSELLGHIQIDKVNVDSLSFQKVQYSASQAIWVVWHAYEYYAQLNNTQIVLIFG